MDYYPDPKTIIEDLKFYVSPALAQHLEEHPELKPVGQTIVINQLLPTTSSLQTLIPKIWAQTIERNLWQRSQIDPDFYLTDEERAFYERKRRNRKHYKHKVAWSKKHAKRRRKRAS